MIQNNKKNYTDYRMTTDCKVVDTILPLVSGAWLIAPGRRNAPSPYFLINLIKLCKINIPGQQNIRSKITSGSLSRNIT